MIELYIGNLDNSVTKRELEKVLMDYARVYNTRVIPNKNKNEIYAFTETETIEDATLIQLKLHGALWYGKQMHVKRAISKPSQRSQQINRRKRMKANELEDKNFGNRYDNYE